MADSANSAKKLTGWYGAGQEPPPGWQKPKWRTLPTKMLRLPEELHGLILEIARAADASPDPAAYLRSLRPAIAPPSPETAPTALADGEIESMNVAQLRKLAAARGMTGAARANKSALLEFLS